jgi:guanylate kinase
MNHGSLFIISGTSGAGKTSIVEGLIRTYKIGKRIITCTTRPPRENNGVMEVDGVDYRFLTHESFRALIEEGAFAEHAVVYPEHDWSVNRYYGTLKQDVEEARAVSAYAFAIVDVQGVRSLKHVYPDALAIFIEVPRHEIGERLRRRGMSDEVVGRRLAEYETEMQYLSLFDRTILNQEGKLEDATKKLFTIASWHHSLREFAYTMPPLF